MRAVALDQRILRTLEVVLLANEVQRRHQFEQVRKAWAECDKRALQHLGAVFIPTKDAYDNVVRLRRDIVALDQQLERVEGRNNNQRQVDSLSSRKTRVQTELERAEAQLVRLTGAYKTEWSKDETIAIVDEWTQLSRRAKTLAEQLGLRTKRDEEVRATTRVALLGAVERQIKLTLENITGQIQGPLDTYLDAWGDPSGELGQPESELADALRDPEIMELREQLRDLIIQRTEHTYPIPYPLKRPDEFHAISNSG